MLKIAHKYCQILQHETTDKSFSILNAFSNCSQHTSLRSCYCFNIFKPCRTVTSVFLKRFISRVRKCSTKFHLNSPLSSCTDGFYSKHQSMWSVSSNHFAGNVRFGSHGELADMVQNFYLISVFY